MRKLYYITCIIVLSCVLASGFIIPLTTDSSSALKVQSTANSEVNGEYLIKSGGDRVVVYKKGRDKPYIETSTSVSSLPADVQAKLNVGIPYEDEASMKKALDEFCS